MSRRLPSFSSSSSSCLPRNHPTKQETKSFLCAQEKEKKICFAVFFSGGILTSAVCVLHTEGEGKTMNQTLKRFGKHLLLLLLLLLLFHGAYFFKSITPVSCLKNRELMKLEAAAPSSSISHFLPSFCVCHFLLQLLIFHAIRENFFFVCTLSLLVK